MTRRAIDVGSRATRDIRDIVRASREMFDDLTALRYRSLILAGIETLAENPLQRTTKSHKDVLGRACIYHLRNVGQTGSDKVRSPRHLIVYTYDDEFLRIIRVLHDAMDLPRHLSIR